MTGALGRGNGSGTGPPSLPDGKAARPLDGDPPTRLSARVVRAIRWDTGGNLAVSLIAFLTTVWLVRILGEGRYGALAALLAAIGLGQIVASGGVRFTLLRFAPETARAGGAGALGKLLAGATIGRTLVFVAVSLPLWLLPERLASALLGRPELAAYLPWLPLLMAPPLLADILAAGLIATYRQPAVRAGEVVNKLAFAAAVVTVPLWIDPLYGVFAAWVGGWLVGIAWMSVVARRAGMLCWPGWRAMRPSRRWLSFSGTAYLLSLIGFVLGRELDILLLAGLGTANQTLAHYQVCFAFVTLAYRLPLLPIAGGFSLPLIAELYSRRDLDSLRRLYVAHFEYIYLFVLPLMGGGILVGPELVGAIYGSPYGAQAGLLVALLVLLGLTKLAGVTGSFLLATDRERRSLLVRLSMALVNIVAALLAIPRYGALGAAVATGGALIGLTLWEAVLVHGFLRPRYPLGFLFRTSVASAAMMGTVAVARRALGAGPGLGALLPVVVLGGLVYLAMLLWLRPISPQQADILRSGGADRLSALIGRLSQPPRPAAARPREAS